jgi:hypothetical protein
VAKTLGRKEFSKLFVWRFLIEKRGSIAKKGGGKEHFFNIVA